MYNSSHLIAIIEATAIRLSAEQLPGSEAVGSGLPAGKSETEGKRRYEKAGNGIGDFKAENHPWVAD
jgi:hypothetical protein